MDTPSYRTSAAEMAAIHAAVCRWRRQGLVCSACCELDERAERVAAHQSEAA